MYLITIRKVLSSNKNIGLDSADADNVAGEEKCKIDLGELYSGGGDNNDDGGVDDVGELDTKYWWWC